MSPTRSPASAFSVSPTAHFSHLVQSGRTGKALATAIQAYASPTVRSGYSFIALAAAMSAMCSTSYVVVGCSTIDEKAAKATAARLQRRAKNAEGEKVMILSA